MRINPLSSTDEFGALVLFVVTIIMLVWQYIASRRLAARVQETQQAAGVA